MVKEYTVIALSFSPWEGYGFVCRCDGSQHDEIADRYPELPVVIWWHGDLDLPIGVARIDMKDRGPAITPLP